MSAYALPGLFPPLESSFQRSYHAAPPTADLSSLDKEEKVDYDEEQPEVWIDIKEAKVDAAKLIASLTRKTSAKKQEPSRSSSRTRRRTGERIETSPTHEEAMLFQLSVSFNGRTYTAVRSLPQIRQLRQELAEEQQTFGETSQCILIPEVPRLHDSVQTGGSPDGFAGRGFSFLQAILRSYTPTLETWLRTVTTLVSPSKSPNLAHFLWEPHHFEKELSHRPSLQGLDAIEESDSENDCDDE